MQYAISFLEGIVTFISPCLLPMLPIYISYFAGGGERSTGKNLRPLPPIFVCCLENICKTPKFYPFVNTSLSALWKSPCTVLPTFRNVTVCFTAS